LKNHRLLSVALARRELKLEDASSIPSEKRLLVRLTQENLEKTLENSEHIATFLFKDHLAGWMEGQKTAACRESIDLDKNDFHGLTRHY
jgi:hypothetical protein